MDSLDTSIYDDGEPLYSTIQYEDDIEEINPFILQLRHYLPQLKERYQTILKLRYMEEKTFEEVAEQLGVTRENIRQLHDKAINQLQLLMGAEQKINKRQRIKPQLRTKKSTL
jgi:RNA polymerase sigma factor (sigma-70 family)